MSGLSVLDATFIGTVLEGLFYGLYCIVFFLYIQSLTTRKLVTRNVLIGPLSILFALCTVYFVLDFVQQFLTILRGQGYHPLTWRLNISTSVIYSFIDFIAQGILIYRCWVVWSRRLVVVIIPSILALVTLGTSLALVGELHSLAQTHHMDKPPSWFNPVGVLSFSLSLAVNAIFTGLLVFKIAKVSLASRRSLPRTEHRRNDLRPLMSMLIESGIVLFVVQLVWVILFRIQSNVYYLFGGPIVMVYGIMPTIIVVRITVQSTHDNQITSVESNMQFAFADENSPTKISGSPFPWNRGSRALYPDESKEIVH